LPESDKLVISEGFFVNPNKNTGSVKLVDLKNYPKVEIEQVSTDKDSYFFHHTEWFASNGRDKKDLVAARAFKSVNPFKKPDGELVMF